jgi:hypothetical protein
VPLTEYDGVGRREAASPSPERPSPVHYLIVRREPTGFEMPHTFFRCGEGVLPLFCAREAAKRFIASRALGSGWYVREFSACELISPLFALHEKVEWVLFSPLPGHLLIEDALSHRTSRDNYIASLIVR